MSLSTPTLRDRVGDAIMRDAKAGKSHRAVSPGPQVGGAGSGGSPGNGDRLAARLGSVDGSATQRPMAIGSKSNDGLARRSSWIRYSPKTADRGPAFRVNPHDVNPDRHSLPVRAECKYQHARHFDSRGHGLNVSSGRRAIDLRHHRIRVHLKSRYHPATRSPPSDIKPWNRSLSLPLKPAMTLLTTTSVATPSMTLTMQTNARKPRPEVVPAEKGFVHGRLP